MTRAGRRSTRLVDLADFICRRTPVPVGEVVNHFREASPGFHRSTLYRMLNQLEDELEVAVIREPKGTVRIDPDEYRFTVRLSLNEAMAVFLAARLLARYSDKPNPHAVKALRRLASALTKSAPLVSDHIARTSDKLDRRMTEPARDYMHVLEELTRAWAGHTRVLLHYRDEPEIARPFDVYFIEPSAVGYLTYVIGYDHHRQSERTFALERIVRLTSTLETYAIPADFDPLTKLAGAWGVNWGNGRPPTRVALRFAAGRVATRVKETNWHETQVLIDLPDGGCRLEITVGSTQEMKPWIRQWGPDCEVLEPPELRREVAEEMRRAGELYDLAR